MGNKQKSIKNFKIKFDGKIYDKIIDFNINTYNKEERVYFTNLDDDSVTTNINCKFTDIEIIKGEENDK
jgi:hypothetical protein